MREPGNLRRAGCSGGAGQAGVVVWAVGCEVRSAFARRVARCRVRTVCLPPGFACRGRDGFRPLPACLTSARRHLPGVDIPGGVSGQQGPVSGGRMRAVKSVCLRGWRASVGCVPMACGGGSPGVWGRSAAGYLPGLRTSTGVAGQRWGVEGESASGTGQVLGSGFMGGHAAVMRPVRPGGAPNTVCTGQRLRRSRRRARNCLQSSG